MVDHVQNTGNVMDYARHVAHTLNSKRLSTKMSFDQLEKLENAISDALAVLATTSTNEWIFSSMVASEDNRCVEFTISPPGQGNRRFSAKVWVRHQSDGG